MLAAAGNLADAERELAHAEHLFRDEVATISNAWVLLLLARVRCRRGRVEEADAALQSALEALAELEDSGRLPDLAGEIDRELAQARRVPGVARFWKHQARRN